MNQLIMATFPELLDNLYEEYENSKVTTSDVCLANPEIDRDPTRIIWKNYQTFLTSVSRDEENFFAFLKKNKNYEYGLKKINDKTSHLIIQGKFKQEDIKKLMIDYVKSYVQCKNCGSLRTDLVKDSVVKTFNITCLKCKSSSWA